MAATTGPPHGGWEGERDYGGSGGGGGGGGGAAGGATVGMTGALSRATSLAASSPPGSVYDGGSGDGGAGGTEGGGVLEIKHPEDLRLVLPHALAQSGVTNEIKVRGRGAVEGSNSRRHQHLTV